jgi:hypothetical protein
VSTLIFGMLVAIPAISNTRSYADIIENTESTELKVLETEMLEVIEQILEEKNMELNIESCAKIYNEKQQLVYQSKDMDDDHLKSLLRRSNLVLQTETSSYYLLDE